MPENNKFKLKIPVDASKVEEFKPGQIVKVGIQQQDGSTQVEKLQLNETGLGSVTYTFPKHPGSLRVVVGPSNASDEELFGLQTLNVQLSARQWLNKPELVLKPILVTTYYWRLWLRWCRTFTISGRVVCPDGSPVPGAKVCAYDVDWWWWWCSRDEVGCATTDETGSFKIDFRWCCGWWPWWWWQNRFWHLVPRLAEVIIPVLRSELKLQKLPIPSPSPSLDVFEKILAEDKRLRQLPVSDSNLSLDVLDGTLAKNTILKRKIKQRVKPELLEGLREQLMQRLPFVPRFEKLQLWPWWKWQPWADCAPDIIFQVTQNCVGEEKVIIDETCWETRRNIPTNLDVSLVAKEACCIDPQDSPDGECMVITKACNNLVSTIGGNPGAAPTPAGYVNPNVRDRPYGGFVRIYGLFGDLANVDYYEFEWSDDGGVSWNDMPPAASGGFDRTYYGPMLGTTDPADFHKVPFSFTDISGRRVILSREHFESVNESASWEDPSRTRYWVDNGDLLFRWLTENKFPDGVYHLRVKSWKLKDGELDNARILPLCNTENENGIVLAIDNRLVGSGSGHPTTSTHPCGDGTVHVCTTEPDTDIIAVTVNGTLVKPCDVINVTENGKLVIDFMAHDPDGHLDHFTLVATYGENQFKNLLMLPSASLAPLSAAQVGPRYADALTPAQGATAPTWSGGTYRLTVDLFEVFPVTCAYQLELRAYKRTIYDCNYNLPHRNLSEYSFTVIKP